MSTRNDSHLRVVARVRSVRERDSRIGLVTALTEERAAAARVDTLKEGLTSVPPHTVGDLASFSYRQHQVDSIGQALLAARSAQQASAVVAVSARQHWESDRTRLAAVEALIERREAARRRELQRREARDMDEVAGELWRRQGDGEDAS